MAGAFALVGLMTSLTLLVSCGESDPGERGDRSSAQQSINWYSGGSLHQADGGDWRQATEPNRLATAADFVAILHSNDNGQGALTRDRLKQKAQVLVSELNAATEGGVADSQAVSELAAMIWLMSEELRSR
ncbi:hypothetical protein [Engelhardtia mirabilis]|uniref:hypothetical protein n=1 Tax=Engelhardtia mirabilis TaxID=2528011 RepID=UPI003AF36E93